MAPGVTCKTRAWVYFEYFLQGAISHDLVQKKQNGTKRVASNDAGTG